MHGTLREKMPAVPQTVQLKGRKRVGNRFFSPPDLAVGFFSLFDGCFCVLMGPPCTTFSGCGWTPAGFHGLSFKDQLCQCCSGYVVFFLAFYFFSVFFFWACLNKSIFLPHFVVQRSTPDTEAEEFSLLCPRRKKDIIFFHCCLRHLPTPWSFSFINIKGGTLCSPDATQPSAQHLHETSCSPGEFPQHLMLFCNTQKWVKKRGFGGGWCGSHKFMVG